MAWDLFDFAVAGALLGAVGVTYALAARKTGSTAYRFAVGIALAAALLLVWVNAAVGVIGTPHDDANLMYGGVLAIGVLGVIVARFQPRGMARALCWTALAQAVVAGIALIAGWGSSGPTWPWDVVGLNGFFTALWLLSAWLFRHAALERRAAGA